MSAALELGDSVGKAVACRALGVPRARRSILPASFRGRAPPASDRGRSALNQPAHQPSRPTDMSKEENGY